MWAPIQSNIFASSSWICMVGLVVVMFVFELHSLVERVGLGALMSERMNLLSLDWEK